MTWSRCSTLTSLSSLRAPQPLPRLSADSVGPCTTVNTSHDVIDFHSILRHSLFASKTTVCDTSSPILPCRGRTKCQAEAGCAWSCRERTQTTRCTRACRTCRCWRTATAQTSVEVRAHQNTITVGDNLHCKYERGCIRRCTCTSSQQPKRGLLLHYEYNFTFNRHFYCSLSIALFTSKRVSGWE